MNKTVLPVQYFHDIYDRPTVWDSLWNSESIGRIAVSVSPNAGRIESIRNRICFELSNPAEKPVNWTPQWETALTDQLYDVAARIELPGDYCPTLYVPRFVHGQSQGITDLFGARVEEQFDGNFFTYPLSADPALIDDIQPKPLDSSVYWGAVEWTRYAHKVIDGTLLITNPVMTGPIDTANYLLGSTVLMEWIYTEPETVHRLLTKITDTIIDMVHALREAGGMMHPLHFACVRGGFDMCSEVRSLLSQTVYEEFEAPYLRRIGEACGPYGIHSCGSWERTIPSALEDPNLRAMNGQIKENDLQSMCDLASSQIMLSIGPSVNVHTHYTWPDMKSFYRHILETVPLSQPFEVSVAEDDLPLWEGLHQEVRGNV